MSSPTADAEGSAAMQRINRTWLEGRPEDLAPMLHPEITMVIPGFSGRVRGRDAIVAGFVDFCGNATIHEYREADHQTDVIGDTAVTTFTYEMVYERAGQRSRASGRDLWVFAREGGEWIAVWRTMLDLAEQPG
jgi:hypothetical protein